MPRQDTKSDKSAQKTNGNLCWCLSLHLHTILYNPFLSVSLSVSVLGSVNTPSDRLLWLSSTEEAQTMITSNEYKNEYRPFLYNATLILENYASKRTSQIFVL